MSHKLQFTPPPEEQPDSWHLHVAEEGTPQAEHGRTNAVILAVAFIASFSFVGLVILATVLYFEVEMTKRREAVIETTVLGEEARAYKRQALAELQTYTFPHEQEARAGVVSIPLEEAKQRVIAKYARSGSR